MVMQKKINNFTTEDESHQFAFYSSEQTALNLVPGSSLVIDDEELIHRMVRVVKLTIGEKCVIFNQNYHALVELVDCLRREIHFRLISCHENKQLQPQITFLLPVLKKEALEEAVYSLAELGITSIQLISTQKSRRSLMEKEIGRLQKIIIAAAEQSKHYAFPALYPVKNLQECLNGLSLKSDKVVFDISGELFWDIRKQLTLNDMYIIVGPEGGLTAQELCIIKEQGFKVCALTQTVLRALQAVAVGAALFRIS